MPLASEKFYRVYALKVFAVCLAKPLPRGVLADISCKGFELAFAFYDPIVQLGEKIGVGMAKLLVLASWEGTNSVFATTPQ